MAVIVSVAVGSSVGGTGVSVDVGIFSKSDVNLTLTVLAAAVYNWDFSSIVKSLGEQPTKIIVNNRKTTNILFIRRPHFFNRIKYSKYPFTLIRIIISDPASGIYIKPSAQAREFIKLPLIFANIFQRKINAAVRK
jgi:hypothetical protein